MLFCERGKAANGDARREKRRDSPPTPSSISWCWCSHSGGSASALSEPNDEASQRNKTVLAIGALQPSRKQTQITTRLSCVQRADGHGTISRPTSRSHRCERYMPRLCAPACLPGLAALPACLSMIHPLLTSSWTAARPASRLQPVRFSPFFYLTPSAPS